MKRVFIFLSIVFFTSCGDSESGNPTESVLDDTSSSLASSSSKEPLRSSSSSLASSSSKEPLRSSSSSLASSSSKESPRSSSFSLASSSSKESPRSSSFSLASSSSKEPPRNSSSLLASSSSKEPPRRSSSSFASSSSKEPPRNSSSSLASSSSQELPGSSYSSFESSSSIEIQNNSSSSLSCVYGEALFDDRDSTTYKTVVVGSQIWMAENLNFEHSIGESAAQKSRCLYNDSSYCDKYGQLYPWTVAIDSALLDTVSNIKCGSKDLTNCSLPSKWKGICPEGWHLPTKAEWQQLVKNVGGEDIAAKKLKSATLWDGEDAVCFSALPAGKYAQYQFWSEGESAYFWMADFRKTNSSGAYNIFMVSNRDAHGTISVDMTYYAYSVRCIKD